MYALVKVPKQGTNGHLRPVLYGICGNRRLLEKIRAGQEFPEEWRVAVVGLDTLCQCDGTRCKAG